jgi:hypothetical protein
VSKINLGLQIPCYLRLKKILFLKEIGFLRSLLSESTSKFVKTLTTAKDKSKPTRKGLIKRQGEVKTLIFIPFCLWKTGRFKSSLSLACHSSLRSESLAISRFLPLVEMTRGDFSRWSK